MSVKSETEKKRFYLVGDPVPVSIFPGLLGCPQSSDACVIPIGKTFRYIFEPPRWRRYVPQASSLPRKASRILSKIYTWERLAKPLRNRKLVWCVLPFSPRLQRGRWSAPCGSKGFAKKRAPSEWKHAPHHAGVLLLNVFEIGISCINAIS